jgi:hypothetical protein
MLATLLLSLSAAAVVPPASPPTPWATPILPVSAAKPAKCIRPNPILAQRPGEALPNRRLDELPPGRLELAVVREVERCPIPAVLRENIGRR